MSPGGGGFTKYILSDGDVPFYMVSSSPIFSRMGHQKWANFFKPVVKICQIGLLSSIIFVFLSIIFTESGFLI